MLRFGWCWGLGNKPAAGDGDSKKNPRSTERKGHDSARRARHFPGWTFKRMSMISLDIRINCRLRGPYSEWRLF